MRTLFSRSHATVYPSQGVFLAGPTSPSGQMLSSWRREVVNQLMERYKISDDSVIVSPEPLDGTWQSIESTSGAPNQVSENDQIAWELQYLDLCDITAFWLPVYWSQESAGNYSPNIGPTTRWEFGMMLEKYLSQPRRTLIVGAPEDAESIAWVRHVCKQYKIEIHCLSQSSKEALVCDSFVDAIAEALQGTERN